MFADLMEREEIVHLGVFEELAAEIGLDFDWDTSLPELDEPWPHHVPDELDLRGMVAWLTGRPDVTTYLYDLRELEAYEQQQTERDQDMTAVLDVVMSDA